MDLTIGGTSLFWTRRTTIGMSLDLSRIGAMLKIRAPLMCAPSLPAIAKNITSLGQGEVIIT